MGDEGEFWRDMAPVLKQESRRKKARNKGFALQKLEEMNIEHISHNNGIHLEVKSDSETFDYWPTTGKWIGRKTGIKDRGIFNLINQIKKDKPA